LMWFFDRLLPIDVPAERVRIALGRAENARFQNFTHVSSEAEDRLRTEYGSLEAFVERIADESLQLVTAKAELRGSDGATPGRVLDEAASSLSDGEALELLNALTTSVPAKERARLRRMYERSMRLRKILKALYEDQCQVCGFRFEKRKGGWY